MDDGESTAVHLPSAREHQPHGFGINAVLLDQNPRRQGIDGVVSADRHAGLDDDRSRIELRVTRWTVAPETLTP